jgi:hypothetical protein
MKIPIVLLLLSLTCCSVAQAKSAAPPAPRQESAPAVPVIPNEAPWVDSLLIGAAALFVAAALIGPLYRLNLPEELPPTHSHDEPPGASHRHGPSGTIDYSAPERH